MFKKWMKNITFAVALSVTLATTSMPAAVFADVNTEQTVVNNEATEQTGYGTDDTHLTAGKYSVPVSLMNATNPGSASMAASCITGDATMVIGEDGSVKVTVPIGPVTMGNTTVYASAWKVYSAGTDSATTDAEYTTDEDGNVNSITFTVPDTTADGVYVNMAVNVMNRTMNPDAFLTLNYTSASEIIDTTAIETAISKADEVNVKEYTIATRTNFTEKLAAAKEAFANQESQSAIDTAEADLKAAMDALVKQTGYGTENTEIAAGKYTATASLMNATDITRASMAASCIAGDATLVIGEDGNVKVTVPITCVTVFGQTAYASDWKVYSDGITSELTAAEYTTGEDGNVDSITFTVPDKATDGVYVNMTAMGRSMQAFIKLDYASVKELVETKELSAAIDTAAALNQKDYTADSWKVVEEKLEAAKKAISEKKSQEEIDAAVKALNEAVKGLQKATASTSTETQTSTSTEAQTSTSTEAQTDTSTQTQSTTTTPTKKTTTNTKKKATVVKSFTVSGKKYKRLSGKKVALVGITSKKATSVTVPATVKFKGVTYKVTRVAEKAFHNNKKIRTVIIGTNVKTIGYQSFQGCKNLKKIIVKTRKLNKIGALAFKGINKKAVFKVPASKKKAYKKLVKGKGQAKTVKVK